MLTPKQIDTFVDNLKNAYSIASHLITEDSIRHFFIEALVANGISINDIAIEVPYVVNPSKKGKGKKSSTPISIIYKTWFNSERNRADIYCYSITGAHSDFNRKANKNHDIIIETKYHRATIYSANCTTSKAGEAFNDLNRLSMIDADNKYFVYVFDCEMYNSYNGEKTHYASDIFKKTFAVGSRKTIDSNYPVCATAMSVKNFKKNAFHTFKDSYSDFSHFNYAVESIYNDIIVKDKLWCIILKVDANKRP